MTQLLQTRQCPKCGKGMTQRTDNSTAKGWRWQCLPCRNTDQSRRRARARHAERMESEPEYQEKKRGHWRHGLGDRYTGLAPEEQRLQNRRSYKLMNKYGITVAQYDEMLDRQGGCCAICGSDDPKQKPNGYSSRYSFAVDHCHRTGAVRGLLCRNCNQGLGHFDDNRDSLQQAISYLNGGHRDLVSAIHDRIDA